MIHQALLKKAVAGRDPVLIDFVDQLAPAILTRFTTIPALGGSGDTVPDDPCIPPDINRISQVSLERFSNKEDQSMTTHILNGIFAGMRLAEKLPTHKALNDLEKRLWLLGFVTHDYTKVFGVEVKAGNIPQIRQMIDCLGQSMNFDDFLPEWETYLDDIAFLAQNTQTVAGANLDSASFTNLQTQPRRLEVLRLLSSIADVLVHVNNPCEVVRVGSDGRDRATNLREKMNILFGVGQAPRLTFHQLSEVRGLISNLINTVAMNMLLAQSHEAFLFFPNGVVYLAPSEQQNSVNKEALADAIWTNIKDIVSDSENFGVRRGGTGFVASSALAEVIGFDGVLQTARRKAMRISSSYATSRLYGYLTGQSDNDLLKQLGGDKDQVQIVQTELVQENKLPDDVRVDQLAEFLTFVQRAVRDSFKGKSDVTPTLIATLNLDGVISDAEATKNKGGTAFGWFYVAASYILKHSEADGNDIEETMYQIIEQTLEWIESNGFQPKTQSSIEDDVKNYILGVVEFDNAQQQDSQTSFANELAQYITNKDGKRPLCSLCSTPYENVGQEAAEIPFINQQYSNKNPLSTSAILRGVCPVCRMEMILRRIQQPGAEQGNKPIFLFLYPTYFFTPETASVVKSYLNNELQDISIFNFLNHMRKNQFTISSLLEYDGFNAREDGHRYTISDPIYSNHDAAGLFFTAIRPLGKKPTDTDSWIVPILYGLVFPLLLNVKVVVTSSFVPLFNSGTEFRETAVLDAPHSFTQHVLGRDRFRVNEIERYLMRLLRLYDLHLDVFAEPKDMHWPLINAVAKDVATDPLYVFSYYDRKKRGDSSDKKSKKKTKEPTESKGIPPWDIERYFDIYFTLGGEPDMGIFSEIVDAYAAFYRAKYNKLDSAYAVLKPLSEAADVIIDSDPQTSENDLQLLVAGAVSDLMNRVWTNKADGWDPIVMVKGATTSRAERKAASWDSQIAFTNIFINRVFREYCDGDRATLRERLNRLRSAARFYYLQKYGRQAEPELEAIENE